MTKTFTNTLTHAEEELRFACFFRPYEAKNKVLSIAFHIHSAKMMSIDYEFTKTYPDALKVIKERIVDVDPHFKITKTPDWGITASFDKTDDDESIQLSLINAQLILKDIGISHSGLIGVISGFPDISYGQDCLEYTTSVSDMNLLDIVKLISPSEDSYIKGMKDVPIVSAYKFDPEKDTDLEYFYEATSAGLSRLLAKQIPIAGLSDVLKDLVSSVNKELVKINKNKKTENSKERTYSSKNSDEYSNFQSNWI